MREFLDFLWGLIPQKDDDSMKMWKWRWKSVGLGLAALVLSLYASNLIPFIAPPYALAKTVTTNDTEDLKFRNETNTRFDGINGRLNIIIAQQHNGQVRQSNNDLLEAERYKCRAVNSNDKTTLPFWTKRLEQLKQSYSDLTGDSWDEVPCNSF